MTLRLPTAWFRAPRGEAYRVYLIYRAVWSLLFLMIVTVNLVYQASVVGLNPLQLVLVGTLLEATCFLGEIPTGVVADVYSRRLSVIIGTFLFGAGFVLEGSIPQFWSVMVSQVIWGLGATFISGALEAWIADEVGDARAGHAFMRGTQADLIGGILGAAMGSILAGIRINVPILLGGALFILVALWLIRAMPETGFHPAPRENRSGWRSLTDVARAGWKTVRSRPALLSILAIGAIYGMFSEGADRLWTPHLLSSFVLPSLGPLKPVVWFGIITVVAMLLGMAATEIARRRVDTSSHRSVAGALAAIYLVVIAAVVLLGVARSFPAALVALWVSQPLRRVTGPLYAAWVNQRLDSSVRATILSAGSQADALGQILGGPLLGLIATAVSIRAALVVAALTLVPSLALFARTVRREDAPAP